MDRAYEQSIMAEQILDSLPPLSPSLGESLKAPNTNSQNHINLPWDTDSYSNPTTTASTTENSLSKHPSETSNSVEFSENNNRPPTPSSDTDGRSTNYTTSGDEAEFEEGVTVESSVMFELGRKMARLYLCENHSCSSCGDDLAYIRSKLRRGSYGSIVADRLLHLGMLEIFQSILRKMFQDTFAKESEFPSIFTPEVLHSCAIVLNMTDASTDVRRKVLQMNFHIDIINFLKSDLLNSNFKTMDPEFDRHVFVESLIGTLYNIVQIIDEARECFREQDIVNVLKNFLTDTEESVSCLAMILLAWVINESENDIIDSHKEIFTFLEKELQIVLSTRHSSQSCYTTIELLAAVNKLAVNDKNKDKIVQSGMLSSYTKLFESSNAQEQFLAAQLLWTLASKCADEIKKDEACVEGLKLLLEKSENYDLKRQVMGALTALDVKYQIPPTAENLSSVNDKPQIFISYQHSYQATVLKIRDRLRNAGYAIWIDVENMSGLIADDIANGINKSSFVLTCLSQKYYESPYCKKEFIYAEGAKKVVIPLILEYKYTPHGWLALELCNKIRIDFSQLENFEESFRSLSRRLKSIDGSNDNVEKQTSSQLTHRETDEPDGVQKAEKHQEMRTEPVCHSTSTTVGVYSWTKENVREWLERNNLHHLIKWFEDYDGRLLLEYQFALKKTPQLVAPSFIAANSVQDFLRVNMALREL